MTGSVVGGGPGRKTQAYDIAGKSIKVPGFGGDWRGDC
jgi:hypothetical protein